MARQEQVRNFVIISHVDHGKSTLADRFLEITNTVPKNEMHSQYLDMMDLEQERGITIKMQPVRMNFNNFVLNMIDTPGHVDFRYEVSRALAAVEGAILLVDAIKGIQAQTLANLELAKKQNLVIIPAINKIDLPNAQVEKTKEEIAKVLNISEKEVFEISAKKGINIDKLLEAVIEKVPPPSDLQKEKAGDRALIFDSKYDSYKGVIAYVRVFEGRFQNAEKIYLIKGKIESETKDIGEFRPQMRSIEELKAGDVGYIATGIKEPGKVRIGDTITKALYELDQVEPLPGYQELKPVVFISIYPENSNDYGLLDQSLIKLKLNDPSLYFEPERKEVFGQGFRCGFLGSLHLEITIERLKREFNLNLVVFAPSVVFKAVDKKGKEIFIYSPTNWDEAEDKEVQEPWAKLEVMTPSHYLGAVMEILESLDGQYIETNYFSAEKLLLVYEIPLREIILGFYDRLMEATQGYASLNYSILEYRKADLVKLEVLIAGEKEKALSRIVPNQKAYQIARTLVKRLKKFLPAQQFNVAIQAVIGGKIIARETISARRKDVTAALYGGDYSRKRKLLEKQKKRKKGMQATGKIKISPKVFLDVLGL